MNPFKVGDKVKYHKGNTTYEVIHIASTHMIIRGSNGAYATSPDRLEIVSSAPDVPDNFNQPINNNSMKYFHTAVLVMDDDSASLRTKSRELIPYAVRCAKDINDMRDTLVRELDKGVVTSDCTFLISPIF